LDCLPQVKQQRNFLLPQFIHIDWIFLNSLILSFVALLLTYDCICGEKEGGTLRLMLAGAVPRHKLLVAKYLSEMFAATGINHCVSLYEQISDTRPSSGTIYEMKIEKTRIASISSSMKCRQRKAGMQFTKGL